MRKWITGLFITLFFLLLGVYHQSHAHLSGDTTGAILAKAVGNPACQQLTTSPSRHTVYSRLHAPGKPKKNYIKIFAADNEEDDDLTAFKKTLEIPRYLTAFFSNDLTDYFSRHFRPGLAYNKLLSYLPADRYIMYLVIRI